jgi:hypothetical protein
MTAAEIAEVEAALALAIPAFLKLWFLENPLSRCGTEHTSLICDRKQIIDENTRLRKEGYYGRLWPKEYLWIGQDGGGGAYFVSVGGGAPSVYWYDWEEGSGTVVDIANSEKVSADEFLRREKEDMD